MKSWKTSILVLVFAVFPGSLHASLIFSLADTSDASFEHDSNGTNSPSPLPSAGSQALGNGTFEWGNLSTDTTPNTAGFSGGVFRSDDWGGLGTFTSNSIDVSTFSSLDISAQFDGRFNNGPTEFSNFFYILDGGSRVDFGIGTGNPIQTDEVVTISNLDVSGASNFQVGFTFSHDGSSDFFGVDSLSVNATPIPEPASFFLLSLVSGFFGWRFCRPRQSN